MSFVITLYTREGIVMASDSRLTLNAQQKTPQGEQTLLAAGMSDSNYKTFLADGKIGVSTFGKADIQGAPISGYIDTFIREHLSSQPTVTGLAQELNQHFRAFEPLPDVGFHVAGYEETDNRSKQMVYKVAPNRNSVEQVNPDRPNGEPSHGATWGGEGDILARLLQPVYTKDNNGNFKKMPHYQIPWNFFTLQDSIDFAVYAIRTTIDSVRFLPRPKTVGGPIDVLVIKPNETMWISRKQLIKN
ncbi:MAG: hypothetical protein K9I68_08790 [Bacteroidales bacterium]|nr:hypothetical protein [Bacteroidales bacterium]MCF8338378.1 hypothetical protein [Bacteroidales bacterium]